MTDAILAIMEEWLRWFHEAVDASSYAFLVPVGGTLSAMRAVTPQVMLSRSSGAPTTEMTWDIRTFTVGTVLALVMISAVRYIRSPWRKLPPGPRGLPILGNALQLMDKKWLFSKDCKERFGESLIETPGLSSRKSQEISCILMQLDNPQSCLTVSNQLSIYSNIVQTTILVVLVSSWRMRFSAMV
jgi:hypothetical protein